MIQEREMREAFNDLMRLVMPQSFPLGIKLVKRDESWPDKVTRPEKFGLKVTLCQWTTMARRWGWVMGARAEDIMCVPCQIAFGFKEVADRGDLAKFFMDIGYTDRSELAATIVDETDSLEPGKYQGVLAFPLDKAPIDPDVVVIYGTPAQMVRLVTGQMHYTGRKVGALTGFGLSCLDAVKPAVTGRPWLVHPGRGERIFAGTDDGEMFFCLPADQLGQLIDGLEQTYRKGIRYPMQGNLLFEPNVPPSWGELAAKLSDPASVPTQGGAKP